MPDADLDRLFVLGHRWALETAVSLSVSVVSGAGSVVAEPAALMVATAPALVACKFHAIADRRVVVPSDRKDECMGASSSSIAPRHAPLTKASDRESLRQTGLSRGGVRMLFQVNYTPRSGGSAKENEESARRAQALFAKWTPPAGMEVKSFHARADGRGGTVVVEANDVKVLLDGPSKFGMVNEFEIVPILDITDAVAVQNEALDWVASIS